MALASDQLQWLLVRKHNAFQVKKDGITFSSEPNNPTNLSTYKFSGLCNSKSVGVSEVTDSKGKKSLVLSVKCKKANKPTKAFAKYGLSRSNKRNIASITKATKLSYYRADISDATVARYLKLKNALSSKANIEDIISKLKDKEEEE
ncbi:hypothetical protein AAMO2058_001304100 [Amorphochlora amoebiformis]|mmetsp:Transcript_15870/g.25129  ORF Transcript_15870/g.25129 Transcript_15870/m.25129 type:complete len:147 (-) Transcript_15870:72-512(-)